MAKAAGQEEKDFDVVMGELCPVCSQKSLALTEREQEIPYFGKEEMISPDCHSLIFILAKPNNYVLARVI